ncbi:MAG TPA: hypothetical protein VFI38_01935 [Candidatus Acidoferrum sp.]|nr:hypothetical protein [Candidatus Acidoferrum sp.]
MPDMKEKLDITFHSDFPPQLCLAKLAEQIDVDHFTLLSFSGYKGNKPILGRVAGNEFRLHKRRYWHNSFGPVLFGRVLPDFKGTTVEAYWDIWKWPRVFMRVWLGFAVASGIPIFLVSARDALRERSLVSNNNWLGLAVPLIFVLFGLLFPRIGAALSFHERKHIIKLLEGALMAGPKPLRETNRDWKTSVDSWWG